MHKIEDIIDRVHCEDCLTFMRGMEDNSVDLVLTDPPYGIKEARKNNASRGKQRGGLQNAAWGCSQEYPIEAWDDEPPTQEVFDAIQRVGQNQIIFGANHFSDKLPKSSCWLVWDKDNGNNDFADCELAYTSFSTAVRKFVWRWHGMLQEDMKNKEIRYHRNQKPVGLICQWLEKYTKEGDTILDCYAGSGSILVACQRMGRHFIGIEISREYCDIAEKRIQQERDNCGLFPD